MEEILRWVIPIVASTIITTILGFLIKHYLTKYFNKIEQERKDKIAREEAEKAELAKYRKEEEDKKLANLISNAVEKANEPLCEKIDEIDAKLEQDRKATITVLRSKMKTLRDQYKKQKYADAGDKATGEELYNDYAEMGGNFFREGVNQGREEVRALPLEPPANTVEIDDLPLNNPGVRPLVYTATAAPASSVKIVPTTKKTTTRKRASKKELVDANE